MLRVLVVPAKGGEVRVHRGRWACAMVKALRRHTLSQPRDVWLLASDVVRSFPWGRKTSSNTPCAPPILTPTAPRRGAHCTWLLPTPYELMALELQRRKNASSPSAPAIAPSFFARARMLFFRAGWAMPRRAIFNMGARPNNLHWLNASVVRRDRVAESEFSRYRYLLDVGGVSGTTWSALRFKLLSGSLVFKVELPWADWWHDTLHPWRDYIPVREDLSDLHKNFLWAEAHPADAQRIAENGALVAAKTSSPVAIRAGVAAALQKLEREAISEPLRIPWKLQQFDPCARSASAA